MKNIIYISDLNLPNNSAQSIQILKMCDAFSNFKNHPVHLFVKFFDKSCSFQKLKKDYILKNSFFIKSVLDIKKKNFLTNLLYSILVSFIVLRFKNKKLVYTRVMLVSIFLSMFRIHHILEIHQELTGFTKKIFNFFYSINNKNYLKIVYINKNLKRYFNIFNKTPNIILDDASDYKDFKKKEKKVYNSCVYSGSLSKGKGFEFIIELAKNLKYINFEIYGEEKTYLGNLKEIKKIKNLKINGSISYKDIPSALKQNKILLMPYNKVSFGRSKNVNLSKYMSPLKLFDYLACGRIIIASKLPVYTHILKHNFNSFIINRLNISVWKRKIENTLKNYNKYYQIRYNAIKTSKNFTWEMRVKKINLFNEK